MISWVGNGRLLPALSPPTPAAPALDPPLPPEELPALPPLSIAVAAWPALPPAPLPAAALGVAPADATGSGALPAVELPSCDERVGPHAASNAKQTPVSGRVHALIE